MVEVFDANEPAYIHWMDVHPQGFVVNTGRKDGSRDAILHRSQCMHIYVMKSQEPGAFTDREYIKVCADSSGELQAWIAAHRSSAKMSYCQTCKA
jgi:hypothetical protein